MSKLWPSISTRVTTGRYISIRSKNALPLELSSICVIVFFNNSINRSWTWLISSCPTSIDAIVKKRYDYDYDAMDEDEKDEIVNSLSKDAFGVVRSGDQTVLCREDYLEYTQKVKSIRGALSNVNIEHEKVGRIMQDGGSALDDGDIKRVFCCFK